MIMRQVVEKRGLLEQISTTASAIMTIALLVLTVFAIPVASRLRRTYQKVDHLLDRVHIDLAPIMAVVGMVRRAAKSLAFLVCVDGLASYVTAFARVFRDPVRTGRRGRPHLKAIPGLLLGQVIKHHSGRGLVDVTRRVVRGTAEAIARKTP